MREVHSVEDLTYEGKPIIVCFTNPVSCAPCRALAPHLANVSGIFAEEVDFAEVNVLDHMDVATEFGVMGTPTLLLIDEQGTRPLMARATLPLVSEIKERLAK